MVRHSSDPFPTARKHPIKITLAILAITATIVGIAHWAVQQPEPVIVLAANGKFVLAESFTRQISATGEGHSYRFVRFGSYTDPSHKQATANSK